MKKILIINGITIRQNENGLFSLVDLCKAGGKKSATSFINSMCSVQKMQSLQSSGVDMSKIYTAKQNKGTFICKELVILYAEYIGGDFLKQISLYFPDLVDNDLQKNPRPYIQSLYDAVETATIYLHLSRVVVNTMICQRFDVSSLNSLSQDKITSAIEYVHHLIILSRKKA